MGAEPAWYETAFGRGYLAVYPHRDLAAARAEADWLVRQGVGGRTLDLGCGFGRHTLALRELGVPAFGLDASAELLAHAAEHQAGSGSAARLDGCLARGDFRSLPFAERSFACVCMLFASFGYFGDEENARVLGEVRRVLERGGRAVLDLMNPALVRAALVPRSRGSGAGYVLEEERALAEGGRRVVKDVRLSLEGEERPRAWREDVRLYEPEEIRTLAQEAGLAVERIVGDFDGRALEPRSPRQIVWARAR